MSSDPRDGEIPPHAPPGGLLGTLFLIYAASAVALGIPFWLITR